MRLILVLVLALHYWVDIIETKEEDIRGKWNMGHSSRLVSKGKYLAKSITGIVLEEGNRDKAEGTLRASNRILILNLGAELKP